VPPTFCTEDQGKAAQRSVPVYAHRFDWETPVGNLRSPHTLEVPFVFDNLKENSVRNGGGPQTLALTAPNVAPAFHQLNRFLGCVTIPSIPGRSHEREDASAGGAERVENPIRFLGLGLWR
jgi:hypothetical protein